MRIKIKLLSTLVLLFVFAAAKKLNAQNTMQQTSSGLLYKIIQGSGQQKPKQGELVKFQYRYIVEPKDSILQSTFEKMPSYAKLDMGPQTKYSFIEVIPEMNIGDSAEVLISVDSLVSKKMLPDYNEVLQKGSTIKCQLKLMQSFTSDSATQADFGKEIELEKVKEIKAIEAYMKQNNITGIKTENGVYISMENAGDASLKADTGKIVSIKYKGYLLNGKVFDTNMDSSKGHTDPIDVPVGQHRVISGWEEALPHFGKGGKGKILIPAMLGYGPQAMGEDIPAYSNLIFDIEVVDVKNNQ